MKLDFRQRLLTTTLLVGASAFTTPAFAQEQNPPGDNSEQTTSTVEGTVAPGTSATSQTPDQPGTSGEIIVTGSRIPQPNLTSASPVTVVSAQEVKFQGTTRTEDLLNSLPQAFADQGSTDANGATGIATVNLRNLGSQRTLVLINGRRLGPGDPNSPVADLNFIPASIIKRVDVLTGGASSVYGSDALAGVVNFIMDTDFTGIRIDGQASVYNHDNRANSLITDALSAAGYGFPTGMTTDGGQQTITVSIGADMGSDHRGHVLAYAGYTNINAITQGDRDFSACGLSGVVDPDVGIFCGGSSTSAPGRFRATRQTGTSGGRPIYGATGPSFSVDPVTGQFINAAGTFAGSPSSFDTRFRFNFNPYNYFQRPDERYILGAFAHYEISDAFDPYMEAMFMDDRTVAQIAPSGAFYGSDFFVNCNNPFLSGAAATSLCGANAGTDTLQSIYLGRRNVEGGPRVSDLRHTDYRIVTGLRGDITRGVSYDMYAQIGRSIYQNTNTGDFSIRRLNNALDVVLDANGNPACRTALPNANGIVTDPLCVPYNPFQVGGVTQAAVDYLSTPNKTTGQVSQNLANAVLTFSGSEYGFQSPFSTKGIGLAIGAEYRKDSLDLDQDIQNLTGDISGTGAPNGTPDAHGSTSVKEVFAEAEIPLVNERPGFYDLSLNLSGRHSKYNLAGSTDSYKAAIEYAPTPDAKLRASYNRAVRAPNVLELFTPPTVVLFGTGGNDPCSDGLDPDNPGFLVGGGSVAGCLASFPGVPTADALAALTAGIDPSPAFQYNQRVAGNGALKPEVGDSYTVGLVLTPRFLRGFNATIDGFDIRVDKVIGAVGANFSLNQCVNTQNPFFCGRINRAPDGSLFTGPSFVDNPTENLGSLRTRGIDVNASYRTPVLFGNARIAFDLVGTYLDKFIVQPLGGDQDIGKYNCAGYFGDSCGTPAPKWRHKFRATTAINQYLTVSAAWRHFSGVKNDLESNNDLIGGGPGTSVDNFVVPKIKQQNYFDLALQGTFQKYTMRIGAQNIFDRQPPITPNFSNNGSNTYAQVYDSLGRYLYASATLDF